MANAGSFSRCNPRPGPGRPKRLVEDAYIKATVGRVSLKDWRAIVDRAVADAIAGNHRAREWLSRILLGPRGDDDAPADTGQPTTFRFVIAGAEDPPAAA